MRNVSGGSCWANLLEKLRDLDPHNEAVYRDIAGTQARLGRRSAVPRTLALLVAALDEIGEQPSQDTRALFDALRRPRTAPATSATAKRPA